MLHRPETQIPINANGTTALLLKALREKKLWARNAQFRLASTPYHENSTFASQTLGSARIVCSVVHPPAT